MAKLTGIVAPFTTPFSEGGALRLDLVKSQVDWLIDNGVHGLAAGGSMAAACLLTSDGPSK